jgi:hypothetical protein
MVVVVVEATVVDAATTGDGVAGEPPPQPAIELIAAHTETRTAARTPEKTKDNGDSMFQRLGRRRECRWTFVRARWDATRRHRPCETAKDELSSIAATPAACTKLRAGASTGRGCRFYPCRRRAGTMDGRRRWPPEITP